MRNHYRFSCIGVATLLLLAAGCAARDRAATPTTVTPAEARAVVVLDGHTGAPATWNAVLQRAAAADFVLLGETHNHPLGLAFASELWSDVLQHAPGAALALEFFERDEQSRIDEYLYGITDEETFRKRTLRTPGSYPDGHRAMLEAAKRAGRPVIAANAPRPYVRYARHNTFDKLQTLTAEQQRLFRIPDALPTGRYRDAFFRMMSSMASHGAPGAAKTSAPKRPAAANAGGKAAAPAPSTQPPHHAAAGGEPDPMIEAMFRSQSLWDWTMADSIAAAARRENRPVFLVVGRFHIEHDGGLPQALRALYPGANPLTVTVVDEQSSTLREEERGAADFVVYVGPMKAK